MRQKKVKRIRSYVPKRISMSTSEKARLLKVAKDHGVTSREIIELALYEEYVGGNENVSIYGNISTT